MIFLTQSQPVTKTGSNEKESLREHMAVPVPTIEHKAEDMSYLSYH